MLAMQVFLTIIFLAILVGIGLYVGLKGPAQRAIRAGLERERRLAEEARQRELEEARRRALLDEARREVEELSLEARLGRQREDR